MTLRSGQEPASVEAWRQLLEEGQHRTALEFSEIVAVVIGRARNGPRMNGDQQQSSGNRGKPGAQCDLCRRLLS
jgi:hypothetical protein